MVGRENLAVTQELEKLESERRESEIKKYEKIIQDFDVLLNDKNELIKKLATSAGKTHVVIELADAFEHLYGYGKSNIATNEIANFLVKKLEGYVHPSTVWDNLPSRFKSHKNNPNLEERDAGLGNPSGISSLNIVPEKENAAWIIAITNQIDFLRSFRTKLTNSHFVSLLPNQDKKNLGETLHRINTIIRISNKVFDDRQSVPIEFQHLLAASFIENTDNFAAGIYITKVKDFGANRSKDAREKLRKLAETGVAATKADDTLTPKQAMKIELGRIRKVAEIYEPKNRNEALLLGYYGTQCPNPECTSWRIETELNGSKLECHCFACENNFDARTAAKCKKCYLPFYDEILEVMKQNATSIEDAAIKTTCPQCTHEVILPINYLPLVVKARK